MRVLFLTRYGPQGASSRLRSFQFLPALSGSDIECVVSPLFDDELLLKKYRNGSYAAKGVCAAYWRRISVLLGRHHFDLLWVEKEALPWLPAWVERVLLRDRPYVLDFDDAIFHNYDLHRHALVRHIYGRRIDRLMAGARLVVAGNHYLAARAIASGVNQVEVLPTVVDMSRYSPKREYVPSEKLRIVWIGSPSTVQYLKQLQNPLRELSMRLPFILRVIGGGEFAMPGIETEVVAWSTHTEAKAVSECDVGIMPLRDSPWEQGKCAYKLIQYMACGLPTVSSPIGANRDVVIEGTTGFFADTPEVWVERLESLLRNAELRQRLGTAGRVRVENEYSLTHIAPKLIDLLVKAGSR